MASSGDPGKKAIDLMKDYKGGTLPSPIIPLSGIVLGLSLPQLLLRLESLIPLVWSTLNPQDSLLIMLQALGLCLSPLFFSEFVFGAAARVSSAHASFSPAAAAASGANPFAVVQANRICQNNIESAMMFVPAALATTAAGANVRTLVAYTATWMASRGLYRMGYCNTTNPFWRICGVFMSNSQTILCWYLFAQTKL
jgi:uncharacterized MAPEG superfamily protein